MVFVLLLKRKKYFFFPLGRANGIIWSTAQFQLRRRHPHLIFTNEKLCLALHDTAGVESSRCWHSRSITFLSICGNLCCTAWAWSQIRVWFESHSLLTGQMASGIGTHFYKFGCKGNWWPLTGARAFPGCCRVTNIAKTEQHLPGKLS